MKFGINRNVFNVKRLGHKALISDPTLSSGYVTSEETLKEQIKSFSSIKLESEEDKSKMLSQSSHENKTVILIYHLLPPTSLSCTKHMQASIFSNSSLILF
jgi:hypothetical protein